MLINVFFLDFSFLIITDNSFCVQIFVCRLSLASCVEGLWIKDAVDLTQERDATPNQVVFNNYEKELQMSSVAPLLREGARGLGIDSQSVSEKTK